MKNPDHVARATEIGNDSWQLQHFEQLRKNASIAAQIEALESDQLWQAHHSIEISGQMDELIRDIREDTQ